MKVQFPPGLVERAETLFPHYYSLAEDMRLGKAKPTLERLQLEAHIARQNVADWLGTALEAKMAAKKEAVVGLVQEVENFLHQQAMTTTT